MRRRCSEKAKGQNATRRISNDDDDDGVRDCPRALGVGMMQVVAVAGSVSGVYWLRRHTVEQALQLHTAERRMLQLNKGQVVQRTVGRTEAHTGNCTYEPDR
jgi:hypothetical protein